MPTNLVYLIISCLINYYLNYLLLDYFIKKSLSNTPEPEPQAEPEPEPQAEPDPESRPISDQGFMIEQKFIKRVNVTTNEEKIYTKDYKAIATELGVPVKKARVGIRNCVTGNNGSKTYKGYKWTEYTMLINANFK